MELSRDLKEKGDKIKMGLFGIKRQPEKKSNIYKIEKVEEEKKQPDTYEVDNQENKDNDDIFSVEE